MSYEKEAERLQQLRDKVLSEDSACDFSPDVSEYEPDEQGDSSSVSSDNSKTPKPRQKIFGKKQ